MLIMYMAYILDILRKLGEVAPFIMICLSKIKLLIGKLLCKKKILV